jgi:hypothetical protein
MGYYHGPSGRAVFLATSERIARALVADSAIALPSSSFWYKVSQLPALRDSDLVR